MLKLGLMGCGLVASYGHVPAIERTPGVTLHSIFEPNPSRLAECKEKWKVPQGFSDAEAFFNSGIDAVVVTSPAPAHLDNVLMAARHRKPVLCEKPLAMTESDAERMIVTMEQAGVPLYVGFTYRFSPVALEIKRMVRDGDIGRILSSRLIYLWDCHGKYHPRNDCESQNPHRLGRMLEGGPMVDCGVHQIDLARWWLDSDVVHSHGAGAWVDGFEAPDHMWLHMDHASGAHTMVEMSYSYGHTSAQCHPLFVYEMIGTEGMVRYDRQNRTFVVQNRTGTHHLPWHEEKNFDGMYQEFRRALLTGVRGNMPTGRDGLIATRLARAATEEVVARKQMATAASAETSRGAA